MIGRDPVYPARKKLLLKVLSSIFDKDRSDIKVVDIGCNNGDTTNSINKLGFKVVGIDGDKGLIERCKKDYPTTKFVVSDFEEKLDMPDSSVDVIWAGDVIEHVVDTNSFLIELNRILKKGGYLILSTPYHGLIKNLVIALVNFDKHYDPRGEHVRFYTKKTLFKQLNDVGYKIIKHYLIGRIKPIAKNLFVVARKL